MDRDVAAEISDLLARTHRRLRKHAGTDLGALGVTPSQLRTLRVLARDGDQRVTELARRLDIVPRSATSVVDGLERAGYVRRQADPTDRRATIVELTSAGRDVMAEVNRRRHAGMEELLARLTPADRDELVRLLTCMVGDQATSPSAPVSSV